MAALSMSHIGLNRWRLAFEGASSGLCCLPVLRLGRLEISALPEKEVVVTGSGATLVFWPLLFRSACLLCVTRICSWRRR